MGPKSEYICFVCLSCSWGRQSPLPHMMLNDWVKVTLSPTMHDQSLAVQQRESKCVITQKLRNLEKHRGDHYGSQISASNSFFSTDCGALYLRTSSIIPSLYGWRPLICVSSTKAAAGLALPEHHSGLAFPTAFMHECMTTFSFVFCLK